MDNDAMVQTLQEMQVALAQVVQSVEAGGGDAAVVTAIGQLQAQLTALQVQGAAPLTGSVQLATVVLTVMPDLLYRVGRDGICRDNFVRNLPWDISQVENPVGLHLRQILPLAIADRHLAHVDQALTTGTMQCYEQETDLGDTVQYDEVRIVPYSNDEVLIIVRDISDRKRAELSRNQAVDDLQKLNGELEARVKQRTVELRQQEQQMTEFFENAHDLLQSVNLTTGHFEYVNRAWLSTLGYTEAEVADLTIFEVLHPQCHPHCQQVAADVLAGKIDSLNSLEMTFVTKDGREVMLEGSITCHANKAGEMLTRGIFRDVSDHRRAAIALQQQVKREQLLREISQRIRQSLDLQTIFDTACTEIRQLLGVDRVGIFKFHPESHYDDGEFVAEAGAEDIPSVLAVRVHDHCFGDNYAHLYAQGRYYAVDDIYSNGLKPCHSEILAQFQVRANLVMPLLCGAELWGLLCIHQCHGPRTWADSEVSLTQEIAQQLAIAIQQASFYAQSQRELAVRQRAEAQLAQQLRQQEALGKIIQYIRQSLNLEEILTTVTWQVQSLLGADRVIVFRLFPDGRSRILEEAVVADLPQMRDRQWEDETWSQEILDWYWQGQPRIVPDVMADRWTDCLVDYSREGCIQSKMVAPILQEMHGPENHRWVAPKENNKLWGVLVVHACHEQRVWQDAEAQLLQQIANQLAIAIQQSGLFAQLQQELKERQQAQKLLTERHAQLSVSNQELARATRLKDEFLANMSHELRTPLNAILGMAEALQEAVFGNINPQQIKSLQTIERSGTHLLSLINDILDVAKIESGQITLQPSEVAVSSLCESSLAFVHQQALKKRLQLTLDLPPQTPNLSVDERRVRQVLINLLSNAVKFTPEGGKITLAVAIAPDAIGDRGALCLSVIDTGIGISPEDQARLFQPFVQVDSALNRKYEGTGLGLVLTKRIVELHGGSVTLTSAVGKGSRFTITLPLAQSAQTCPPPSVDNPALPAAAAPAALAAPAGNSAPLILLVEDNPATIETIAAYLEVKGYRLMLAHNGHRALEVLQTHRPDLILMDIQMPEMDGFEAIEQVRQMPALAQVPIIALTALAMAGDRDRCLAAGANEYLSKPVRLKQLNEHIQAWLRTPALAR